MRSRPRRLTMYRVVNVEPGKLFTLDPASALFVLTEKGCYRPPAWHLELLQEPRCGSNEAMIAMHTAPRPFLPAA